MSNGFSGVFLNFSKLASNFRTAVEKLERKHCLNSPILCLQAPGFIFFLFFFNLVFVLFFSFEILRGSHPEVKIYHQGLPASNSFRIKTERNLG